MRHSHITVIVALVCCMAAHMGQAQEDSSAYYQKQYAKIYKEYVSDPSDVAVIVELADFYTCPGNFMRNLPLAMKYLREAESAYVTILSDDSRYRELNRLVRKKITITSIREQKSQVIAGVKNYLNTSPKLSDIEIECFVEQFENEPAVSQQIKALKITQLNRRTKDNPSLDNYYVFLKDYAGTQEADSAEAYMAAKAAELLPRLATPGQVDSLANRYPLSTSMQRAAESRKADLAYLEANRQGTMEAYQTYLSRYPSGKSYVNVLDKMDSLLAIEYASINTPSGYVEFIKNHGDSPLADQAILEIRRMITEQHNPQAAETYLENFPLDPNYNDIFREYYNWHAYEGNRTPIESFAQKYPNFPFQYVLQGDLTQGTRIDAFNLMNPFNPAHTEEYASFIRMNTGKKIAFVALQRLIQHDRASKNWKAILSRIETHEISFETDCANEYKELKQIVMDKGSASPISELSPTFNLSHPVIHPNDSTLYYNRDGQIYRATLHIVKKKGRSWASDGPIRFDNSENLGYNIFSFYDNGRKMLLGKSGDILTAELRDSAWHLTETLPYPVNTTAIETDAFMLPDGSGILLASDRAGSHNIQKSGVYFHGDTALASDLYYIPLTANGWGDPVNLGIDVNSEYSERCPVMSQDMQTLYFVTDGRGGFGFGDIYTATRKDHSWTRWTTPKSLGRDVNSGFNETALSINGQDNRLFYATAPQGELYYCYSVAIRHTVDSALVLGPRPSIWERRDGKVQVVGYTAEQLSGSNVTMAMPRVDFHWTPETNEYLYNDAELDILATFLNEHSQLNIDIITHCNDTIDADSYTKTLHRGQCVKQYLVQRGVGNDRINVSAYGNTAAKTGKKEPPVAVRFF